MSINWLVGGLYAAPQYARRGQPIGAPRASACCPSDPQQSGPPKGWLALWMPAAASPWPRAALCAVPEGGPARDTDRPGWLCVF